jgi:hypothetical protein
VNHRAFRLSSQVYYCQVKHEHSSCEHECSVAKVCVAATGEPLAYRNRELTDRTSFAGALHRTTGSRDAEAVPQRKGAQQQQERANPARRQLVFVKQRFAKDWRRFWRGQRRRRN